VETDVIQEEIQRATLDSRELSTQYTRVVRWYCAANGRFRGVLALQSAEIHSLVVCKQKPQVINGDYFINGSADSRQTSVRRCFDAVARW